MIGQADLLGRPFGFPYFPLTPTWPWLGPLGLVPLPSKWTIDFADPISMAEYGPEAAEDPILVNRLAEEVRSIIQRHDRRPPGAAALRVVRLTERGSAAR